MGNEDAAWGVSFNWLQKFTEYSVKKYHFGNQILRMLKNVKEKCWYLLIE